MGAGIGRVEVALVIRCAVIVLAGAPAFDSQRIVGEGAAQLGGVAVIGLTEWTKGRSEGKRTREILPRLRSSLGPWEIQPLSVERLIVNE